MLIAAGATSCIIEFLEPDYENNKVIVCLLLLYIKKNIYILYRI